MPSRLIAVIPAYDCERTIAGVVAGCLRHVREVVVVDDGSRDRTAELAEGAGALVERRLVNGGKGTALRQGMGKALDLLADRGAVVLLDGDGQHDADDIPALVAPWESGMADLVIGSRWGDIAAIPPVRYWTNYIGSRILSRMCGHDLEDSQSGFRVLDATLGRRLRLRATGYGIESEMLISTARLGARLVHVPVRTIYEVDGTSHFRPVLDTVRISLAAIRAKVFHDA